MPRENTHVRIFGQYGERDGIYGQEFKRRIRNLGMDELRTALRSPWQNPYVERMIGTLRRDCLDHMIVFRERQLHRILTEFLDYYHRVRPHRSLADDSPDGQEIEGDIREKIVALPVLGGLHHRELASAEFFGLTRTHG